MKKIILGTFPSRANAESLIQHLRRELRVPTDDISYVYRKADGTLMEVESEKIRADSPSREVKLGASIGALFGVVGSGAVILGIVPAIASALILSPFVALFGTGIVTSVSILILGVIGGALLGTIAGTFFHFENGLLERENEERIGTGDVLVVTHTKNDSDVSHAFASHHALGIYMYTPTM